MVDTYQFELCWHPASFPYYTPSLPLWTPLSVGVQVRKTCPSLEKEKQPWFFSAGAGLTGEWHMDWVQQVDKQF